MGVGGYLDRARRPLSAVALLIAAPLFVVAPSTRRLRFSSLASSPQLSSSFRSLRSPRGRSSELSYSDRGLERCWGHHGPAASASRLDVDGSFPRILPIVLSVVLAWWLLRRLGASVREPLPLTALLALSLSLRLVLKENLHHTYYFMALAVALLLLDVVRGHIRGTLLPG